MRVPASWLREFVDIPAESTPEDIHAALVRVGLEEEDIHRAELSGPIVVGTVLEFVDEPQSNGKTIRWCQVDVGPRVEPVETEGERDIRGIVCGAHNFFAGDKVVVSLPGAVLPGPFPISARKTYGHVSDGMIASAKELGLGDEHAGILRLTELGLDPEPATDAIALLGLDDYSVEVNVTPDRGYAFSIRGIAREYSNSTGATFRDPALAPALLELVDATHDGFSVTVADQAPIRGNVGCSVFVTRVVRGIDPTRPTPAWMVSRLKLAGVRSISLAVDVTNYVMFELGQPIHGYDLARLGGGITVRRANPGEKLTTLDEQVRTLSAEDLLITDESGPIGLAGVMGGAATEISDATTDVLIEAANFDPVSIARTARRHKLPSEASKRFERGVDPLVAEAAAARVAQLLVELAGGTIDELGSSLFEASSPAPITLRDGFVSALLGVEYMPEEVRSSLEAIGATVEPLNAGLAVTPPSWRPDLDDEPTLAEEVARLVGYDRIPSVLPVAPPGRGLSREQVLRRVAANMLAANGLTEVQSYPFVSKATHERFSGDAPAMRLANPLDAEVPLLRRSVIPGLLDARAATSRAGSRSSRSSRSARSSSRSPGAATGAARCRPATRIRVTPCSPSSMRVSRPSRGMSARCSSVTASCASRVSRRCPPRSRDAIAAARQLAAGLAVTLRVEQGNHPAYHPGRTAELYAGDRVVGIAVNCCRRSPTISTSLASSRSSRSISTRSSISGDRDRRDADLLVPRRDAGCLARRAGGDPRRRCARGGHGGCRCAARARVPRRRLPGPGHRGGRQVAHLRAAVPWT
jgi:phenylalanyl-tRNA synthetase beta chain